MKSILILILKVILLTFLMFILMAIGGLLVTSQPDTSQTTSGSSAAAMFRIAIVCLIDVIILTYFILRARLTGIKLMIVTAILFYGIKTFLAVIEFWFFVASVMNDSHLISNPLIPPAVQKVHFIETASSNFIWGLGIVLALKWREVTKYTRQQVVGR